MTRVAFVTALPCGSGHAVRGVALVRAGARAGIEVRAFGPPKPEVPEPEYEGSRDWAGRAQHWAPDLLLSDRGCTLVADLRAALTVPAWLLLRYAPDYLPDGTWERRIAIEPIAAPMPAITDAIPPIVVGAPRFAPTDGQELHAGYNTWWEATWFGYRNRVRWLRDGNPEREARIAAGGAMSENGADVLMRMIEGA
jgi:hypothetical protein